MDIEVSPGEMDIDEAGTVTLGSGMADHIGLRQPTREMIMPAPSTPAARPSPRAAGELEGKHVSPEAKRLEPP